MCAEPQKSTKSTHAANLFRGDFTAEIEDQISRRWLDSQLANHADNLSAMQCCVIAHVLHLIAQPHRAGIAAEKFEWQLHVQYRVVQFRNIPRALIDEIGPALFQRCEIRARVSGPQRPRLSFGRRASMP